MTIYFNKRFKLLREYDRILCYNMNREIGG